MRSCLVLFIHSLFLYFSLKFPVIAHCKRVTEVTTPNCLKVEHYMAKCLQGWTHSPGARKLCHLWYIILCIINGRASIIYAGANWEATENLWTLAKFSCLGLMKQSCGESWGKWKGSSCPNWTKGNWLELPMFYCYNNQTTTNPL